jgi:hypothetical protein
MFIIATIAASSYTPSIPLKIIMNSNAHHSMHISNVVGTASFKYSPQALIDSTSNRGQLYEVNLDFLNTFTYSS